MSINEIIEMLLNAFASVPAMVAAAFIVTQLLKDKIGWDGWKSLLLTALVSVAMTGVGVGFQLGVFEGINFWNALYMVALEVLAYSVGIHALKKQVYDKLKTS